MEMILMRKNGEVRFFNLCFPLLLVFKMQLCQPLIDGTDCSDAGNHHRYIEKYTCMNPEATDEMLREMRLSFPSGHASFAFYTMIFSVVS